MHHKKKKSCVEVIHLCKGITVHKPAYQPAVEYEQADVSTANCIQHIKKRNISRKINFTIKI
ncbi:hypothetical protein T11_1961 [Trichinella zimbabwensis]|uniref:Uncharacterized protein n=1 Tax=Trichinella zimbabwensis TaxID=268475 RepID=A0A0V1I0W5_9BILA|nr:hypothetical protein T11_1961 [Trichinella zimbabwensis]